VFDPLARDYDAQFTRSPVAAWLRDRVHTRLERHFQPGARVLELGCGTGEDALRLARRGVTVVATDASPAMLAQTGAKTGDTPNVTTALLDLAALPANPGPPLDGVFDGVFANFGPLNCLDDWLPLARWLARRVRPGGIVALGMMSRYCLWEIGWHGLHGDLTTARRRLSGRAPFRAGDSAFTITYPSPAQLTRAFAPDFWRVHLQPLGLLLPPSDAYPVVERRPRLLRLLMAGERVVGRLAPLATLADHYWIEFERSQTDAF
jgi:SAM-dependent methyltransferase